MQRSRNSGANMQFHKAVLRPCGFAFRGRRSGRRNLGRGSHFPLSAPLAAEMGAEKGAFLLSEFHIFVFLRPWPQIRAQNRAQNSPDAVNFSCHFLILGPPNFGQSEILSLTPAFSEREDVMMRKSWWALFIYEAW